MGCRPSTSKWCRQSTAFRVETQVPCFLVQDLTKIEQRRTGTFWARIAGQTQPNPSDSKRAEPVPIDRQFRFGTAGWGGWLALLPQVERKPDFIEFASACQLAVTLRVCAPPILTLLKDAIPRRGQIVTRASRYCACRFFQFQVDSGRVDDPPTTRTASS